MSDLPFGSAHLSQSQKTNDCNIIHAIQAGRKLLGHEKFIIINHFLYFIMRDKTPLVYIPISPCQLYLDFYHSHLLAGNLNSHKMLKKLWSRFYWPYLHEDLCRFIEEGPICQATNSPLTTKGTLSPIMVSKPFELVGWDFICRFLTSG